MARRKRPAPASPAVDEGSSSPTPPHLIDEIDFDLQAPHINRYNWLQREYTRMVHKNAQLMLLTRGVRRAAPPYQRTSARHS